jgi:hypothetical protein
MLKATSGPVTSVTSLDTVAKTLANRNPDWDPYRQILNSSVFARPGISGGGLFYKGPDGTPQIGALIDFTKFQTDRNDNPLRNPDGSIVYNKYAGSTPVEYARAFLNSIPYDASYAGPATPAPPRTFQPQPPAEVAPPVVPQRQAPLAAPAPKPDPDAGQRTRDMFQKSLSDWLKGS